MTDYKSCELKEFLKIFNRYSELEQDYFTDMFIDAFGEDEEITLLQMRELVYARENEHYFLWTLEEACGCDTVTGSARACSHSIFGPKCLYPK